MSTPPPAAPETSPRDEASCPTPNIGGQAVLNGVMMRSPNFYTVAVRRQNGSIVVKEALWRSTIPAWMRKTPFLRGALVLFESLSIGMQALRFSTAEFEKDLPLNERPQSVGDARLERVAVLGMVGFFIALPKIVAWVLPRLLGSALTMGDPRFHVLAGVAKLALFVGYVALLRTTAEGKNFFQYHGAEHKAIAVHEGGDALTVESARRYSTRHARCGTTFMLVVAMVSVGVFAVTLPLLLPNTSGPLVLLASIVLSVPLMIPIAGVSYELQRLGARFAEHPIARFFLAPGYAVQGITTAPPNDDQVEIALVALRRAVALEAAHARANETSPAVRTFASFAHFATENGEL
jgi:uncharacterized protein YqhQ